MTPPKFLLAFAPVVFAACAGTAQTPPEKISAVAELKDAQGAPAGRAVVTQAADGLWLDVTARGLTPGAHGLHVHAVGTCTAPDFASAGPHWNPSGHQHGRKNPAGAHSGDAPNLIADAAGLGSLKTWLGAGTIRDGAQPMLDGDGAAVVIHAEPDDEMTDPSGKSGTRVICGVLSLR